MTPTKAIEHLRLEAARVEVGEGTEPVNRVAETGFRDPQRIPRAFSQPPQGLRRAARA